MPNFPKSRNQILIDWITLRCPIKSISDDDFLALVPYFATLEIKNTLTGEMIKTKLVADVDMVRSDFQGLVVSLSSNGCEKYLNVGASPASLEFGGNLFGSSDYFHCKKIILDTLRKVLFDAFFIKDEDWLPRRIDVTTNYFFETPHQVKEALNILRCCDGIRQRATTNQKMGDTVGFGLGSTLISGKAYHKGPQTEKLNARKVKYLKPAIYSENQLQMMQHILRLEASLGRTFFERLSKSKYISKGATFDGDFIDVSHLDNHEQFLTDLKQKHIQENFITADCKLTGIKQSTNFEHFLTPEFLANEHDKFFRKFIGNAEVTDMDTLLKKLFEVAPTEKRAYAAYNTYLRIVQNGYSHVESVMPDRTFRDHRSFLFKAGLCHADLVNQKIVPLRRRNLMLEPVFDWDHLQQLIRKVA